MSVFPGSGTKRISKPESATLKRPPPPNARSSAKPYGTVHLGTLRGNPKPVGAFPGEQSRCLLQELVPALKGGFGGPWVCWGQGRVGPWNLRLRALRGGGVLEVAGFGTFGGFEA